MTASGIVLNGTLLSMPDALSNVVPRPPEKLPQCGSLVTFPYTVLPGHYLPFEFSTAAPNGWGTGWGREW